jgi:uncharacterized protein with NRDE domain
VCTLILATRVFDESPAFLASNRDEHLDRPAHGPLLWDRVPRFVAPRDDKEGGTWLGVNEHGVLVAITNRFGAAPDDNKRSRGALVVDALGGTSAAHAAEIVTKHAPDAHNPFHLVFADVAHACSVWSDGETMTSFELPRGVHVVTERSFGAAPNGRGEFLEHAVAELTAARRLTPAALTRLLAVHRPNDPDATSVLLPEYNYGTRSSTLIDIAQRRLQFADGPPTEADYTDYSDLLHGLLAG